jgi:hypothetical protein
MPKRPRQAHIPNQSKRRKVRRPDPGAATVRQPDVARNGSSRVDEPVFADPPVRPEAGFLGAGPIAPAAPRVGRRVGSLRTPLDRGEALSAARVNPGQLPTFERTYLMRELRQIGVISTSLLALIIILTIILR